jgi:hypothetical protein
MSARDVKPKRLVLARERDRRRTTERVADESEGYRIIRTTNHRGRRVANATFQKAALVRARVRFARQIIDFTSFYRRRCEIASAVAVTLVLRGLVGYVL